MEIIEKIISDTPFGGNQITVTFSDSELTHITSAIDAYIDILKEKIKNELEDDNDRLADLNESILDEVEAIKRDLETI